MSQAGQGHSLHPARVRGAHRSLLHVSSPTQQGGRHGGFPKQQLTRCAQEGAEGLSVIALKCRRFPGSSPGPCTRRKTSHSRRRLGTSPTRAFFGAHYQFQRAGLSSKDLCSRELASPSFYSWGLEAQIYY